MTESSGYSTERSKVSEREKLIQELDIKFGHIFLTCTTHDEMLADFILADRKRIVEPLVKYKLLIELKLVTNKRFVDESIDKTIKIAGI